MRFFKKHKAKVPEYWETYLTHFQTTTHPKTSIADLHFFVLDTETSGLDMRKDNLLSIAGLSLRKQVIYLAESFDCFLAAETMRSTKSVPIHGIVPSSKTEQIDLEKALIQLLTLLQNKILVGHHILFDIKMLNRALATLGAGKIQNQYLDTAILAQRLGTIQNLKQNQGISLDALCAHYGLKMHGRHTAAGDALLTSLVFCRQLNEFEAKGLNKLKNLLQAPIKTYRY